jgi:LuxR family maltose regulon positive regulatory protein
MIEHLSALFNIYEDQGIDAPGIHALDAMLATTPQEETWRLGWIHNTLAIAYTRSEELDSAHSHAQRALVCYREERSIYPQIFMLIHLSFISLRANRLDAALDYGRQAEDLIRSRQWADANLLSIAQVPMASLRYLSGDVAGARQALERAMPSMAKGEGWVDFFVRGYATLSRARFAQEKAIYGALAGLTAARDALAEGMAVADARGLARLRLSLTVVELELSTQAGQFDAARAVVRRLPDPDDADHWPTGREQAEAQLAHARLALRSADFDAAEKWIACLAQENESHPARQELMLRLDLLRTELAIVRDDRATALEWLAHAAERAQPGGQVQQVHDEMGLPDLIRALVRRTGIGRLSSVTAEFVTRIARRPPTDDSLLSQREAEILQLLDEGLSNKAIARRMGVTESTVKFHLKNLFAKLGVSRRTLALSVARTNGLLNR